MSPQARPAARSGDRVRVTYVGRFADGTVFDSSEGQVPLEFTLGAGEVIAGFDAAVLGLLPGECRTVAIPPEQGYGPHLPEMLAEIERRMIPDDHQLAVGSFLEVSAANGATFEVQVVALSDTTVRLDANHPLAGKELHFEIRLLDFV
jgi:FKBP-type peptidyl-prolyl cis-trans isomerase 2